MSRTVATILLCEDRQHEAFARRFLEAMAWPLRNPRVLLAQRGRGSGEQFVRTSFPAELKALRASHVRSALLVFIDGDNVGPRVRVQSLHRACSDANVDPPQVNDPVAVFVPTWRIETWIAHLSDPPSTVDETDRGYPRLERPRECQPHVDRLAEECRTQTVPPRRPAALAAACAEWRRIRQLLDE